MKAMVQFSDDHWQQQIEEVNIMSCIFLIFQYISKCHAMRNASLDALLIFLGSLDEILLLGVVKQ